MTVFDAETGRGLLDGVAMMLLATAVGSVLAKRLNKSIYLLAGQGLLLALVAAIVALTTGSGHSYIAIGVTLLIKVLAVPGILLYALRDVRIKQEVDIVIPRKISWLIAVGLVLVAYRAAGPRVAMDGFLSTNALPIAVSMLLIGLLNMLIRKKALSQVIGIVSMENGLYLMSVVATQGLPIAVELGVAIDLVVGVLIMGVVARRINQTFDTINTDRLRTLKG